MMHNNIPDYWSAEQALAVYEFILELQQQIWDQYELQLYELLRSDLDESDADQLDLFFNDDIPF
jgi:tRNA U34 5-methylaminomethyl-2-thiouridine-forming methyltransferase MnmC